MINNAFYFKLKVHFAYKIIKLLSRLFGHLDKQLDQKDQDNFKIYDDTTWKTNNSNTHIAQYRKK